MNKLTNKVILIEGLDRTGKTTLALRLAEYFKTIGYNVFHKHPSRTLGNLPIKPENNVEYFNRYKKSLDEHIDYFKSGLFKEPYVIIHDRGFPSLLTYQMLRTEFLNEPYLGEELGLLAKKYEPNKFFLPTQIILLEAGFDNMEYLSRFNVEKPFLSEKRITPTKSFLKKLSTGQAFLREHIKTRYSQMPITRQPFLTDDNIDQISLSIIRKIGK